MREFTHFPIRGVAAAQTRPIRAGVLRPHQNAAELVFSGDDDALTRHFGAFDAEGNLVGVASIYREDAPPELRDFAPQNAWRLRGMATLPAVRGRGVGRELLENALSWAKSQGGAAVWCNAREIAVPFYRKSGFEICGERFELPEIGPHFLMWRAL